MPLERKAPGVIFRQPVNEPLQTGIKSVDAMIADIGKKVRAMPQIKIDDELVGGYNQLIEHFTDLGLVNYKGEKIVKDG